MYDYLQMQSDYGAFYATQIYDGSEFWCLIHEIQDDNSCFLNNVATIVESYKEGTLYGLRVYETDSMYERGARNDILFCRNLDGTPSYYLLPCFCITKGTTAILFWVHSRARRCEIGKI